MFGGGKASNYISTVELLEGGKLSMTTKATAPEGDGGATPVVDIVSLAGKVRGNPAAGPKQPVVLNAAAVQVRLQLPSPV